MAKPDIVPLYVHSQDSTLHSDEGTMNLSVINAADTPVVADGTTTARPSAERWSDVWNLKDFGAEGDGIADDTIAMNAWLAKGGRLFAPEGTYVIDPVIATVDFVMIGVRDKVAFVRKTSDPVVLSIIDVPNTIDGQFFDIKYEEDTATGDPANAFQPGDIAGNVRAMPAASEITIQPSWKLLGISGEGTLDNMIGGAWGQVIELFWAGGHFGINHGSGGDGEFHLANETSLIQGQTFVGSPGGDSIRFQNRGAKWSEMSRSQRLQGSLRAVVASSSAIDVRYRDVAVSVTGSSNITTITSSVPGMQVILVWGSGATFSVSNSANIKLDTALGNMTGCLEYSTLSLMGSADGKWVELGRSMVTV